MIKSHSKLFLALAIALLIIVIFWQANQYIHAADIRFPIRVACVGDSITLLNRSPESYPAQLSKILGTKWNVENFGANDTTVLKKGDKPYIKKRAFKLACRFKPNIIIIILGTNDSKEKNWAHKEDFVKDYISLIKNFQRIPSHPKIFLCYPPPAFSTIHEVRDKIIREEMLPLIDEIVKQTGLKSINLYDALCDKKDLFPDTIHPNNQASKIIAETIYNAMPLTMENRQTPQL